MKSTTPQRFSTLGEKDYHKKLEPFLSQIPLETIGATKTILQGHSLYVPEGSHTPQLGYLEEGLIRVCLPFKNFSDSPPVIKGPFRDRTYMTTAIICETRFFGLECLAYNHNFFDYVALTDCEFRLFSREWFYDHATVEVYRSLTFEATFYFDRFCQGRYMGNMPQDIRVLAVLKELTFTPHMGKRILEMPFLIADLANMIGIHRNNLRTILNDLEKEKLIEIKQRHLHILDHEKLRKKYTEAVIQYRSTNLS